MALGYTKSSTSMWPSVWYTGRKGGRRGGHVAGRGGTEGGEIAYTAFDGAALLGRLHRDDHRPGRHDVLVSG
jgi:hypothetical protein